ncbi:MAG: PEP-CTERM sorting domain-containing protein [Verrucomicrobiota bacterium]
MKTLTSLVVSSLLGCFGQLSAQTGLTFNLGGAGETVSNQMVFANNGVTATATAWSVNRSSQGLGFAQSQLVQWSPGIGVKNSTEVITDTPYVPFYVDNQDHYDFVLFVFSEKVDITRVKIHPSSGSFDLDASFWLGNVDENLDLTGEVFADLGGYGFGSKINNDGVVSNSPRDLGITTPGDGVNAILIGARIGGDADFDRFKLSSITASTVIPEPSSFAMLAGSLALVVGRRRRNARA